MRNALAREFTTTTVALIPGAIALNIVAGEVVAWLRLPLYLDSLGTVLVAVLAGPWAGALTGGLSNAIWGLWRPTAFPFGLTAIVIGLLTGFLAQRRVFAHWWSVLLGGFAMGLVAAAVSAPIAATLFGGVTGGGTDLLVAYAQAIGASVVQASFAQGFISDSLDKPITFLLIWVALQGIPLRLLMLFPSGERAIAPKKSSHHLTTSN
ncbi:MAG: ECF transporter S component [Chloroflexi bacterium]|nr:ECF transporter S component [Chloroflexota bacterium]